MKFLNDLLYSRKLNKIAKSFAGSERNSADVSMDTLLADKKRRQGARDELFPLLLSNTSITRILNYHEVGELELRDLHGIVGPRIGGWVGRHYVPVHAIGYPMSLHFLLSHRYHEYAHKEFTSPIDVVQLSVKEFFTQGAPLNFKFE